MKAFWRAVMSWSVRPRPSTTTRTVFPWTEPTTPGRKRTPKPDERTGATALPGGRRDHVRDRADRVHVAAEPDHHLPLHGADVSGRGHQPDRVRALLEQFFGTGLCDL